MGLIVMPIDLPHRNGGNQLELQLNEFIAATECKRRFKEKMPRIGNLFEALLADIIFPTAVVVEVPVFYPYKSCLYTGVKITGGEIEPGLYEKAGKIHVDVACQYATTISHIGISDER